MANSTADTSALYSGIANGDRDVVVEWLLGLPARERLALRTGVKRRHDILLAAASSSRSPEGYWVGPLRSGHWSAAQAALLGCSTLTQAVQYAPLDPPDAAELPRAFFPAHLEAFVEEWSARFLRNPKAWDRIRGLHAMFDWAHEGLVAPPVHDGAVLLLATTPPPRVMLWSYLLRRPCLIETTLPRIFDVDGISGASPAQADEHVHPPDRGLGNQVIPRLVARGQWQAEDVQTGIARALARDLGAYQHRWFRSLRDRLDLPA